MVWVNLLPWRRQRLKVKLHRGCTALIVMAAAFGTTMLSIAGQQAVSEQRQKFAQRTKEANSQLDGLKTRINQLDTQRKQLKVQLEASVSQQRHLQEWYQFMQRLADTMPATLWLSGLSKTTDSLILTGSCLRVDEVDAFRQQLQQQPLFRQVETGRLSRSQNVIQFSLQAMLSSGGKHE